MGAALECGEHSLRILRVLLHVALKVGTQLLRAVDGLQDHGVIIGLHLSKPRHDGHLMCEKHIDPLLLKSPQFSAFNLWSGRVKSQGKAELEYMKRWPALAARRRPGSPSRWQSASSRVPNGALIEHSNEASGDQWDYSWPKTR